MPTIIDALKVTLNLDPTGFIQGTKTAHGQTIKFAASTREAYAQMEKEVEKELKEIGKEQAKAAKEAEKQAKAMAAAQDKVSDGLERTARNALRLFAVFTAGKAIADFVRDITNADSALGRLAQRIGQAPADISAVATAVQRTGGSFDAAAGSFQRFSDSIQELKATGNTGILPFLYRVQAAGGKQINLNKDILQTQVDIADNLKAINDKQGAAAANYYGKQLGFDEGTVALMVQGGKAFRAYIEESKRLGIATKEDTDAAQAFQRSIRTLMQASESLGRSIMTAVTPVIVDLLKPLQEWIEKNREWIKTEITARVREFADYLKTINWKAIGQGIRDFVAGCNSAAQAVGGWKNVIEALFALWLGSKFLAVLRAIGLLRLALTGGKLSGGLIGALGILGTAGLAAIIAGSVGSDRGTPNAEKPGVITRSDDENSGAAVGPSGGYADPRLNGDRARFRRWWGRTMPTWLGGESAPSDGIHRRARRAASRAAAEDKSNYNFTGENADVLRQAAKELGTSPEDLATVISYESKFRPGVHGGTGNRYQGLIQFGPSERAQFGANDKQTFKEQMPAVVRFLKTRGFKPGMGLEDLYSTINAGSPGHPNASDGHGTVRSHVAKMRVTEAERVRRFLSSGAQQSIPIAPVAPPPTPAPSTTSQPAAPKPSAWNGIPAAAAAVAQVQAAQAAQISRVSNDNRSSVTHDTDINGGIHIHTNSNDAEGISRDAEGAFKRRSFAMAANYGQA